MKIHGSPIYSPHFQPVSALHKPQATELKVYQPNLFAARFGKKPSWLEQARWTFAAWTTDDNPALGQELLNAVNQDDIARVKALLGKGAKAFINTRDDLGNTALVQAISRRNLPMVEVLLAAGADVNQGIPLINAVWFKDVAIVKALLKQKRLDINKTDENKSTALIYAANTLGFACPEVTQILLTHPEIEVNAPNPRQQNALIKAAGSYNGDKVIQALLKHPDINVQATDHEGNNALMVAAEKGNVRAVQALLNHPSINVNTQNKKKMSALMLAANAEEPAVVEALLRHPDIKVDLSDPEGDTALMYASAGGLRRIKIEIANETPVEKPYLSFSSRDPVEVEKNRTIVKQLLDAGANVNIVDKNHWTPLKEAFFNGDLKVAAMLINKGADIHLPNVKGRSAWMWLAAKDQVKAMKRFNRRAGNIDKKNAMGRTACLEAISKEKINAMNFLLKEGASIHTVDATGQTALMEALQSGNLKVWNAVMQAGAKQVDEKGHPLYLLPGVPQTFRHKSSKISDHYGAEKIVNDINLHVVLQSLLYSSDGKKLKRPGHSWIQGKMSPQLTSIFTALAHFIPAGTNRRIGLRLQFPQPSEPRHTHLLSLSKQDGFLKIEYNDNEIPINNNANFDHVLFLHPSGLYARKGITEYRGKRINALCDPSDHMLTKYLDNLYYSFHLNNHLVPNGMAQIGKQRIKLYGPTLKLVDLDNGEVIAFHELRRGLAPEHLSLWQQMEKALGYWDKDRAQWLAEVNDFSKWRGNVGLPESWVKVNPSQLT